MIRCWKEDGQPQGPSKTKWDGRECGLVQRSTTRPQIQSTQDPTRALKRRGLMRSEWDWWTKAEQDENDRVKVDLKVERGGLVLLVMLGLANLSINFRVIHYSARWFKLHPIHTKLTISLNLRAQVCAPTWAQESNHISPFHRDISLSMDQRYTQVLCQ